MTTFGQISVNRVETEPFSIDGDTLNIEGKPVAWGDFSGASVSEDGWVYMAEPCGDFSAINEFVKLYAYKMKRGKTKFLLTTAQGDEYVFVVAPKAVVRFVGSEQEVVDACFLENGKNRPWRRGKKSWRSKILPVSLTRFLWIKRFHTA